MELIAWHNWGNKLLISDNYYSQSYCLTSKSYHKRIVASTKILLYKLRLTSKFEHRLGLLNCILFWAVLDTDQRQWIRFFSKCALILFARLTKESYPLPPVRNNSWRWSHIVEELLKMGVETTSIDDYFAGKKENLAHLKGYLIFYELKFCVTVLIP